MSFVPSLSSIVVHATVYSHIHVILGSFFLPLLSTFVHDNALAPHESCIRMPILLLTSYAD